MSEHDKTNSETVAGPKVHQVTPEAQAGIDAAVRAAVGLFMEVSAGYSPSKKSFLSKDKRATIPMLSFGGHTTLTNPDTGAASVVPFTFVVAVGDEPGEYLKQVPEAYDAFLGLDKVMGQLIVAAISKTVAEDAAEDEAAMNAALLKAAERNQA